MSVLALVRAVRTPHIIHMVREARNVDFNDALHPRDDEGRFRTVFNRVNRALSAWASGGSKDNERPISGLKLSRLSLIKVARKMGYEPKRGESDESIEDGILAKAREIDASRGDGPKAGGEPEDKRVVLTDAQHDLLSKASASPDGVIDVDKSDPDVKALADHGYLNLDPRSNRAEITGRGELKLKLPRDSKDAPEVPAKKAAPRKAPPESVLGGPTAGIRELLEERRQRREAAGIPDRPSEEQVKGVLGRLTATQLRQLHQELNVPFGRDLRGPGSQVSKPVLVANLWDEVAGGARRTDGDDNRGRINLVDAALEIRPPAPAKKAAPKPERPSTKATTPRDGAGRVQAEADRLDQWAAAPERAPDEAERAREQALRLRERADEFAKADAKHGQPLTRRTPRVGDTAVWTSPQGDRAVGRVTGRGSRKVIQWEGGRAEPVDGAVDTDVTLYAGEAGAPQRPSTAELEAELDSLSTPAQKRARLRKYGYSPSEIDGMVPIGSKSAPRESVLGGKMDEAERVLHTKTPAELKAIADEFNISMPAPARSKEARIRHLLQSIDDASRRSGRIGRHDLLAAANRVTVRPRGSGDVGAAADRVRAAKTPVERVAILDADTGLTPAKLRDVASELGVDLPPRLTRRGDMILYISERAGYSPTEIDAMVPLKAKGAPKTKPNQAQVASIASAFHEDWRKTRLQPDGSFEPRVKKTKDQAWIKAHGTDKVDIANSTYDELPDDWKAENRAAAEVVEGILNRHGGTVDLKDEKTRRRVGEEIHQAWLARNPWAAGGDLDVPFKDLPADEQAKDLDQIAVAMRVRPGAGGTGPKAGSAALAARRSKLKKSAASPVTDRKQFGGFRGGATLETHADGSVTVHKKLKDEPGVMTAERQADAEELASQVAAAVGVSAPAVHRAGPADLQMEHMSGRHIDHDPLSPWKEPPPELAASGSGRRLGLLDLLLGNPERHAGNYLVGDDGQVVALDHGSSFGKHASSGIGYFSGGFVNEAGNDWAPQNDMSPTEMAQMRTRLEALRPEFDRLGRSDWWNTMMENFEIVESRASGSGGAGPKAGSPAAARQRQAQIDEKRKLADLASLVEEIQANGGDPQRNAGALAKRHGLSSEQLSDALTNPDAFAQANGLTRITGRAGSLEPFDPKKHKSIGGTIRQGQLVEVVRPGYSARVGDEDVPLDKADVQEAD